MCVRQLAEMAWNACYIVMRFDNVSAFAGGAVGACVIFIVSILPDQHAPIVNQQGRLASCAGKNDKKNYWKKIFRMVSMY
jgi:hypothetical protein